MHDGKQTKRISIECISYFSTRILCSRFWLSFWQGGPSVRNRTQIRANTAPSTTNKMTKSRTIWHHFKSHMLIMSMNHHILWRTIRWHLETFFGAIRSWFISILTIIQYVYMFCFDIDDCLLLQISVLNPHARWNTLSLAISTIQWGKLALACRYTSDNTLDCNHLLIAFNNRIMD